MRILVTGASGMLGHNLARLASRENKVWGSFHTHPVLIPGCTMFPMQLTNERELKTQVTSIAPDVVIHTAALTDVDECEKQAEVTNRINAQGTRILAAVAEELRARFVYISTDYVFDGETGNYSEEDAPSPVNHYGESKLLGEEFARRCCSQALVLRTTMFGLKVSPRTGLIENLVAALREGKPLLRFMDQYFTPLYTGQLTQVILQLLRLRAEGLFHIGSNARVSRFEFSCQVAQIFGADRADIQPAPFRRIEGIARRPKDTSLVSQLVEERFGVQLPDLRRGLQELKKDWDMKIAKGIAS